MEKSADNNFSNSLWNISSTLTEPESDYGASWMF